MTVRAYWFFGNTLLDGRPIPADGEWLEVKGSLKLCVWGLHASLEPFDALFYAPGPNLALVELDGDIVRGDDKLCASRRRIITRIDATAMLRSFARQQALSVIHLWNAPPVVRAYLETGDEALRGAAESASAARVAALSARSAERAARAATWAASVVAAAWSAACEAAAWSAARQQFNNVVLQHMARAQTRIGEAS